MTTFKNLGIKKIEKRFAGKKIKNMDLILGKPIKIIDFEICPSKRNLGHDFIKMQIVFRDKKRFLTTGGKYLRKILSQVDPKTIRKEGIDTVILQKHGYYYFEGTLVET